MQEGDEQLAVRGTVGFLLWQCQRDIKPLHQALVLLWVAFWSGGQEWERNARLSGHMASGPQLWLPHHLSS